MKQTNNAIKFLMAQYRAIFKNANMAMVAAMAAAALAAGQANAAVGNWDALTDTVDVSAEETITGQAATDTNANGFTINVKTGGTLNILGSASDATSFEMGSDKQGKITVEGGKLVVGNDTASGASVKVTSVTATGGTIEIGGHASETSSLEAATINLGGDNVAVTIKKGGVLGGATSAITVGTGATVALGSETDNSAIAGSKLTVNGGAITVDGAKNFKISSQEVDVQNGSLTNGTGTLTFDKATKINFAADTLTNGGTIDLGTLGNNRSVALSVGADTFNNQLFKESARKVTFAGTASEEATLTLNVAGKADLVGSGLITAADGTIDTTDALNASAEGTTVNVVLNADSADLAADAFDAGSEFKSVKAKFGSLTVGKADSSSAFTVKAGEITVVLCTYSC